MSRPLTTQRAILSPSWIKDRIYRRVLALPSLDLQFANSKSLVNAVSGKPLVTFTRASSGTYVDSAGVLQTAVINEARFTHNPTTRQPLGILVEESRTNLLLNSATLSTQNVTVTAAAHTLSFTGTGTITLSGTSTAGPLVGTGTGEANRVSLTFTPTAGTLTLTVSGTVSNAQLELGSFRTSYIATTGATATRSADVVSITSTNFSSWYNQNEGTLLVDASVLSSSYTTGVLWDIGAGGAQGTSAYCGWNGTQWVLGPNTAPVNMSATTNVGLATSTAIVSCALAANYAAISASGRSGTSDLSCAMPANATTLLIGKAGWTNASYFNGTIGRLTYWPQRLSNIQNRNLSLP